MAAVEEICKRRFLFGPSFPLYEGTKGLWDYGPLGLNIKNNLIAAWRKWFVRKERLLEIATPVLTPAPVLVASGHATKFGDAMVVDLVTGLAYRADHLLEEEFRRRDLTVSRLGEMSLKELTIQLKAYDVRSPDGNLLSEPREYNLMFPLKLGANIKENNAYLRPETAQGIFGNFLRLYDYNNRKLPFGAATVGLAFRNEIAPRGGLLRTREFEQAEIEYFVDPRNKDHPHFHRIAKTWLKLVPRTGPEICTNVNKAVKAGIIAHQTIGYFMAQTQLFLESCGIKRLRFRQHLKDEMAHYAVDCWDCEVDIAGSWVECVGIADRGSFDLTQHQKHSGTSLAVITTATAEKQYRPNKKLVGKLFGSATKDICLALTKPEQVSIQEDGVLKVQVSAGSSYLLTPDMYTIESRASSTLVPHVIEPSFGIGRILTALLHQTFQVRDDGRTLFKLPANLAPCDAVIVPLSNKPELLSLLDEVYQRLLDNDVSVITDTSSTSIGRKYSRWDEVGIPYIVTVDFRSLDDKTVTVRSRDTLNQERLDLDHLDIFFA